MGLGDNVKTSRRRQSPLIPGKESARKPEPVVNNEVEEKIYRHTLRIPASLEHRFMAWYKDQVAAGRKKSEISFNTFVSEAMDNALKTEGYE